MNDMRQGTCPLCGHNEIIEAQPRANASGGSGELYLTDAGGMIEHLVGHLWAYTCRRCDFTQLFAQGAAAVAVGPATRTRLITGPTPQPFR